MATVDFLLGLDVLCQLTEDENEMIGVPVREVAALIRRVERLTEIAHHHLDCSVCREILREIPRFFGMFFIDWHKAMWDDQANMRPW